MPPDSTTCFNAYTNKYCIHQNHFLLVLLASTTFTTKLVNISSLTTLSLSLTLGFTTSGVWSLLTQGEKGECPLGSKGIAAARSVMGLHGHVSFALFLPTFMHKCTLSKVSGWEGDPCLWEPWGHNLSFIRLVGCRARREWTWPGGLSMPQLVPPTQLPDAAVNPVL